MMGEHRGDVVVVGAGFAGASACVALRAAGLDVFLLEGRDRVGGRAFTRPFLATDEAMEFGGSWIAPSHHRIRWHSNRHDIALRPTSAVEVRRWHDGDGLRSDGPAAGGERAGYEAALARVLTDAAGPASGKDRGVSLQNVSFSEYLHHIAANRPARAQILSWWCISGNGDPDTISAAEFISSCAHGDGSPEGMMSALAHSLVPGAGDLVARMIAGSRSHLRLGCAAIRIRQFPNEAVVDTADGESYRARAAILAVPLNVLATLEFARPPAPRKRKAMAMGHGGRSFKVWIRATGAKVGTLVTGGLDGMQWMFAEREAGAGVVMIVGFGLQTGRFDVSRRSDVESGLRRFFPEAELVAHDWHNWVDDPFARGTWLATPARAAWIAEAGEWQNDGRVFFASADFAPGTPGWFESAIVSGEMAAANVLSLVT